MCAFRAPLPDPHASAEREHEIEGVASLARIIHERNRVLDNWICANDLATDPSLALCAGWHDPERSEGRGMA